MDVVSLVHWCRKRVHGIRARNPYHGTDSFGGAVMMNDRLETLEDLSFVMDGATETSAVADMIDSAQVFKDWTRQDVEILARYSKVYETEEGQTILMEGEKGKMICILIDGKIGVYKSDEQGRHKRISLIRAGKTFGEMSLVDEMPYSATAIAMEPTRMVVITGYQFENLIHDQPRVGNCLLMTVARLLSLRLRQTTGTLVDLL